MLSDISNWDWFLEESKQESDEEEVNERKRKKSTRKRRKKSGEDDDDEVWTGESEEDAEIIKKMKNVPKPKYSTRSKEQKQNKGASTSKSAMSTTKKYAKDDYGDDDVDEDEDEEDETLGGFIVDDGDIGEENVEDNEEEEFENDEDEDE